MSQSDFFDNSTYGVTYRDEIVGILRRKENNPSCSLEDLESVLDSLYIQEGNNWEGRGQIQDLILSATISAYEHCIDFIKSNQGKWPCMEDLL